MRSRILKAPLSPQMTKVVPLLTIAVISIMLWLPFGLHIGFWADEWPSIVDPLKGIFWDSQLRPFVKLPWVLVYLLDSHSFVGINLVLLLLIMGKGIFIYLILRELKFDTLFAFGTGVLAVVYPADQGVFYLGGLTIHVTIFMYLLAIWLFLQFWKSNRYWLWIPIYLVSILCLGCYEAVYPLFFVVPAVLVYQQRGITRRVITASVLWLVTPVVFALNFILISTASTSSLTYQNFLLANDRSIGTLLAVYWHTIRYALVDSWINSFFQTIAPTGWGGFGSLFKTASENPFWLYLLSAAAIFLVSAVIIRRVKQSETPRFYIYIGAVIVGILFLMLSFVPYVLSNLRDTHIRTLLHGNQGAALAVSAGIWLIGLLLRRVRVVYMVLVTGLLVTGTTSLFYQHRGYQGEGEKQIPFLQTVVQAAPKLSPDSALVILDETSDQSLGKLFNNMSFYLNAAVQVIYSDPSLASIICYPPTQEPWGRESEVCHFDNDQFMMVRQGAPSISRSYSQIVIFLYGDDRQLKLVSDIQAYTNSTVAKQDYAPTSRIQYDALPTRAYSMLRLSP